MPRRYTYDIVNGPSKSEIELAFYGARSRNVREMIFSLSSGNKNLREFSIIITNIVKMNDDGLLLIEGVYEHGERIGFVSGLFSTDTRKGRMRLNL